MDSLFGFCCINRSKEEFRDSQRSTTSKPIDYIRTRPGLLSVLKWFERVEDKFRDSMSDIRKDVGTIIEELDEQCKEEVVDVNKNG